MIGQIKDQLLRPPVGNRISSSTDYEEIKILLDKAEWVRSFSKYQTFLQELKNAKFLTSQTGRKRGCNL